jgi:hypothetical protein
MSDVRDKYPGSWLTHSFNWPIPANEAKSVSASALFAAARFNAFVITVAQAARTVDCEKKRHRYFLAIRNHAARNIDEHLARYDQATVSWY